MNTVSGRIDGVVGEFADLDGREKLELLLDFAARLPALPPEYAARKGSEDRRVHECQTPVFLWPDVQGGVTRLYAEVAPEAPTVKGFVAILADVVEGRPVDEVLSIGDDLLERMGLAHVLGILRTRGLRAIVGHIKRGVLAASTTPHGTPPP
ncbi:MAG: SufE family protein [Planctomycetota bacterium]|nr:MAG: SufE family protein [Planctomycetota bacterium]